MFFLAIWISLPVSFSLLLTIQLGFLSPIQYFRDLAHPSVSYPLSISFFLETDISPLLLRFPMISRCNIYLGISVGADINKIHSGKWRVRPDFENLHKKFIYNNASEKFIPLSDLGSLLQHFFSEITTSPQYLLLSSVVLKKLTIVIFFSKIFVSIGRNFLPEAKLGEYVVHIIDNPQKKIWVAFSRKSIFKIFRKTAAIFSILKILIFFSDHSIELKIPHHTKGKRTEYLYLVKNCIILAIFMKL